MHVEQGQPGEEKPPEQRRQTLLPAEIDDQQPAARRHSRRAPIERRPMIGDHRQRIREEDPAETGPPEQHLGRKIGGIGEHDPGALRKAPPCQGRASGLQHGSGNVEAVQPRLRVAPPDTDQIAAGATADFQHMAVARRKIGDEAVAAEQIIFAREVIDEPLVAIDPVHRGGGGSGRDGRRRHVAGAQ